MENSKSEHELSRMDVVKSILAVMNLHKATKSTRANYIISKLEKMDNTPPLGALIANEGIVWALKKGLFDSSSEEMDKRYETEHATNSIKEDAKNSIKEGLGALFNSSSSSAPGKTEAQPTSTHTDGAFQENVDSVINEVTSKEEISELNKKINEAHDLHVGNGVLSNAHQHKEETVPFSGTMFEAAYKQQSTENTTPVINTSFTNNVRLTDDQINQVVKEKADFAMIMMPRNESAVMLADPGGQQPAEAPHPQAYSGAEISISIIAIATVAALSKIPTNYKMFTMDRPIQEMVDDSRFVSSVLELGEKLRDGKELSDDDVYREVEKTVFKPGTAINQLESWIMFASNIKQKRTMNPIFKKYEDATGNKFIKKASIAGNHAIDTMLTYIAENDQNMNAKLKSVYKSSREISTHLFSAIAGNEEKIKNEHPDLYDHIIATAPAPKQGKLDSLMRLTGMNNDDILYESRVLVQVMGTLKGCSGADKNFPKETLNALKSMSQIIKSEAENNVLTEDQANVIKGLAKSIDDVSGGIKQKRINSLTR